MKLIARLACAAILSTTVATAMAQGTASPAKKDLVQKVLTLQQSGIEGIGNALANQTATQVLQVAGQAMARVPADKREAVAQEIQGDLRRYVDETLPVVRDRATQEPAAEIASYVVNRLRERGILAGTDGPFHNVIKISKR